MKLKILFLILLVFSISCSSSETTKSNSTDSLEMETAQKNSVHKTFDESSNEPKLIQLDTGQSDSKTETRRFGAQITTMTDGYGNKTEMRTFDDELIKMTIVRTNSDGSKQIFVYGQDGEVKTLTEDSYETVLTSTPAKIAELAKIYPKLKEISPPDKESATTEQIGSAETDLQLVDENESEQIQEEDTIEPVGQQNEIESDNLTSDVEQ